MPYRVHRAGSTNDAIAEAQAAVGSVDNPVTDVQIVAGQLVVSFADGTTESHDLPAGMGGGDDQTARDAAAAAQGTATAAQTDIDEHELATHNTDTTARAAATAAQADIDAHEASTHNTDGTARAAAAAAQTAANALIAAHTRRHDAHHTPPHVGEGGGIVHVLNGRLPGSPVAMRGGWNQSQTHAASIFTRANDHPTDGAAVGMSDGLAAPPFPPALATDATLYLHLWLEGTPDVAGIRRNAHTNPVDVLDLFPDSLSGPLTVDGVAGTVYVSNVRFASMEGVVYDVQVAGATIATTEDVTNPTRYAATFGLLTDIAAGTWANYTSGLDDGELFQAWRVCCCYSCRPR